MFLDRVLRIRSILAATIALISLAVAPARLYAQDVNTADVLGAIVKLSSEISASARTALQLGTKREGHAVVIDSDGLAVTIGYLILEAEKVDLTAADGKTVPARVLAYDHETGFGLVRALQPIAVKPLRLGDSSAAREGDPVLVAGYGGTDNAAAARVAKRRDFAGYWEYLLEDAIFTIPPFPSFGGAALIDSGGRLIGIGSLIIPDAAGTDTRSPGNMFVPINALKPIMADLLERGRSDRPRRPWIGVYTMEQAGHLFVRRVAKDGPAGSAGLAENDIVVAIAGDPIAGQADFYRKLWAQGAPGTEIAISVLRPGKGLVETRVKSIDRYEWLRFPRGN